MREQFELAFREFGLPLRIRTDNGVPFASTAIGGLTDPAVYSNAVSVWNPAGSSPGSSTFQAAFTMIAPTAAG